MPKPDSDTDEFASLYSAIGTSWGGTSGYFNLPDLRVYFLRGATDDETVMLDPDTLNRKRKTGAHDGFVGTTQDSATATPVKKFAMTDSGAHDHDFVEDEQHHYNQVFSTELHTFGFTQGSKKLEGRPFPILESPRPIQTAGAHTHTITGGDAETRPMNAYANFIIKF